MFGVLSVYFCTGGMMLMQRKAKESPSNIVNFKIEGGENLKMEPDTCFQLCDVVYR